MFDFEDCKFLNDQKVWIQMIIGNYFVNMLNKMYVDKKELWVFEIDQGKWHIVKDFRDFQFYKHSSSR
jgi:hypothetical protein